MQIAHLLLRVTRTSYKIICQVDFNQGLSKVLLIKVSKISVLSVQTATIF